MSSGDLKYKIALSLIPGIGPVNAKKIITHTGSAEAIFRESGKNLKLIPGMANTLFDNFPVNEILGKAEKELEFIEKYELDTLFYLDPEYPDRLKQCNDAPIVLFRKGKCELNRQKVISIVGTRRATPGGRELCTNFVKEIGERHPGIIIVSGLAYGIDITAHKASLDNEMSTVAVLAHGLSTLYPAAHRDIAKKITEKGSLLTEFLSYETPEKQNFIKRNRIIAGLSDATIVVESGIKGGALITANMANSYNRDVFAFPGRVNDRWSKGCNRLILTNRAALIEDVSNFEYIMGWQQTEDNKPQKKLLIELDAEEKKLLKKLEENDKLSLDDISAAMDLPGSQLSGILLNLEFKGLIRSLPGKIYSMV